MIDMGVEPYLLAACLRAVLAQRLIRRLCAVCRQPTTLTEAEIAVLKAARCTARPRAAWSPQGCPACLEGYKGRTGLFELMIVNADMANAIRAEHPNSQALRELAIRGGMTTMLDDGADKLARGLTSFAELLRTIGRAS
jgi:general secretion pathway protein E